MTIGSKIRFHRQKRQLTQEELSKGILSVSYLSKIENNSISPSQEIIELLCERLGISNLMDDHRIVLNKLEKWNRLLLWNSLKEADEMETSIALQLENVDELTPHLYYQILCFRADLIHLDLKAALARMNEIHKSYPDMTDLLKFYFHKYRGNYYYLMNEYSNAENELKEAETFYVTGNVVNEEERADLYYLSSLVKTRLNHFRLALYYGEKALNIFQSVYFQKRCAEVHLLLGICYRRIGSLDEANKHYEWAGYISETIHYTRLRSKVEQNLGYMKSLSGESQEAIRHFLRSIDLKGTDTEGQLYSILSLVKEYHKLNDRHKMTDWLDRGLALCDREQHPSKYFELCYYRYAAEGFKDGFEPFMKDQALPFFHRHDMKILYATYSTLLGQYYQGMRKYKNAAFYFKEANDIYEQMVSF
ncbi:transcriptional regulator with XRE-family HTH domain [Rossellomorea marisflavi]